MKVVKNKEIKTDKVIHEIDVTNKGERSIDRMVDGMMINLDHSKYFIDDTCPEEPNRELIK